MTLLSANLVDALSKIALLGSEWVLYLLLILSVISLAAMLERWIYFRRNARSGTDTLREQVRVTLEKGDEAALGTIFSRSESIHGRVLGAAWSWRHGGRGAVEDVLASELGRERPGIERFSNLLGTVGNNTPFIGLFGTVIGVINAFHYLGDSGGRDANMGNVMAGIAEALIATGVGIFVAIPAVIAFNLVQAKASAIEADVHSIGKLITAWLESQGSRAGHQGASDVSGKGT